MKRRSTQSRRRPRASAALPPQSVTTAPVLVDRGAPIRHPFPRKPMRRLDDVGPRGLSLDDERAIDRMILEDKVVSLIERVPKRLLEQMLYLMDDDDLVMLDVVSNGMFWNGDDAVRAASIIRAAKRRTDRKERQRETTVSADIVPFSKAMIRTEQRHEFAPVRPNRPRGVPR